MLFLPPMSDRFKIRLGRPSDVGRVAAVELAAASIFSEQDLPPPIRYMASDLDILRTAVSECRLWVACDSNDVAVAFAFTDMIGDSAYLEEIDVHPNYMRQGIGTRLMQVVIEWARQRGCRELRLVTFSHLAWNAPFYAGLGFRTLQGEEIDADYQQIIDDDAEVGIDARKRVVMELRL